MIRWFLLATLAGFLILFPGPCRAADPAPDDPAIRKAVEKSLPLLTAGARGSMAERARCFTCHNQFLPILALTAARSRGLNIDEDELARQAAFTVAFLEKNRDNYLKGRGQGGQTDTAGYALWALQRAGWKPDATTWAVAEYLLLWQRDWDHWGPQSDRPPSEGSLFTSTHVALLGLKNFGTPEQGERIAARFEQVREWLVKTPAETHEDRVSRLRALRLARAREEEITAAAKELIDTQRADGGWAQLQGMESDAYATGTALTALHEAGEAPVASEAYQKGIAFLLCDQREDGSWHVNSRSKPIQVYYESGYPHEKDQFISITAAGWAAAALALALGDQGSISPISSK